MISVLLCLTWQTYMLIEINIFTESSSMIDAILDDPIWLVEMCWLALPTIFHFPQARRASPPQISHRVLLITSQSLYNLAELALVFLNFWTFQPQIVLNT